MTENQSASGRRCPCGAPAVNLKGPATCADCIERRKQARAQRAKEVWQARRPPVICPRCDKQVPYDAQRPLNRLHDTCREGEPRAVARRRAARPCRKCGSPDVRNARGPATCEKCWATGTLKNRKCSDCGSPFRTRNNSTRCGQCGLKRRNEAAGRTCVICGDRVDHRSRFCLKHKSLVLQGTGKPIGSRRVTTHGYIEIKTESGWRREHAVVLEGLIGRRLSLGESVHHKNGKRDDNRPENLELWARTQPGGARARDLLAWAREIIQRYEGLPTVDD